MPDFMFATGIESSYPVITLPDGSSHRVDEMQKCGHYERWEEDFALTRELGIDALRYGPPYYLAHRGPGRYDWTLADPAFARLRALGITPIVDLCHFGVPDWAGDFQNPDWPALFADYAGAFAARFPWVRFYTPINEIFITARFSAKLGWWNERCTGDRTFVTALKHLCQANILAMHRILEVRPDAVFVQSESSEYFHAENLSVERQAHILNQKRFLALDLTYGYPLRVAMYEFLLDNGMTREEFHWFEDQQVKAHCVMGNDYYVTNEHLVTSQGDVIGSGEIFGYYVITHQYYSRYWLPVMHTETNLGDAALAPGWLQKQWANVQRLRLDGVPIIGFTWYSLTDQVDWDTALRENRGHVVACGLYDLERRLRPVGAAYRALIAQWREVLPAQDLRVRPTW